MERESIKIVEDAKKQAEDIQRETEEKARVVYQQTYEQSITEVKRRIAELVKKTKEYAEREATKILETTQTQIEELQNQANKNFQKAVDFVVNEFVT